MSVSEQVLCAHAGLSPRTQGLVLAEIPGELRGVSLAACHGVRPGELVRLLEPPGVLELGLESLPEQ